MQEKTINPVLKQVLEFGPTVFYLGLYTWIKDETYTISGTEYSGFIAAMLVFVPVLLASMAALWILTGAISRMQVFTAFMVIFFGGLTWYFNDESFFKAKTSIVYGLFAVILGIGLMRGRSYLEWIMGEFLPMKTEGWMILTKRLALLFLALAAANEVIWRTQSEEVWVWLESLAFPAVMFVFLMAQVTALQRFLIEADEDEAKD